jgi:hypothetical protein
MALMGVTNFAASGDDGAPGYSLRFVSACSLIFFSSDEIRQRDFIIIWVKACELNVVERWRKLGTSNTLELLRQFTLIAISLGEMVRYNFLNRRAEDLCRSSCDWNSRCLFWDSFCLLCFEMQTNLRPKPICCCKIC